VQPLVAPRGLRVDDRIECGLLRERASLLAMVDGHRRADFSEHSAADNADYSGTDSEAD